MKTFIKVVRVFALTFFIALAAAGAGFLFAFQPRERYMDKEIKIERVDKTREENENDVQEEKN
jgi:hypothetical protein